MNYSFTSRLVVILSLLTFCINFDAASQTISVTSGLVYQAGITSPPSGAAPLASGISFQQSVGKLISVDLDAWKGNLYQDYGFKGETATLTSLGASIRLSPFNNGERVILPWFGAGVSWGNQRIQADLQDAYGRTYHLWSDGYLYNAPEPNDPLNPRDKIRQLERDYDYETSVEMQRGVTVPLKIGIDLKLTSMIKSHISYTAHMGNANVFDGFNTTKALGATFVSTVQAGIGFNLGTGLVNDLLEEGLVTGVKDLFHKDYLNYEIDFDRDGVNDIIDRCPGTPVGAKVNEFGCPIDTDGDGVPDYEDVEIHSETQYVNKEGKSIPKDEWSKMYSSSASSTSGYKLDHAVIESKVMDIDRVIVPATDVNTAARAEEEAIKRFNKTLTNSAMITYRVQYGVYEDNSTFEPSIEENDKHLEILHGEDGLTHYVGDIYTDLYKARVELSNINSSNEESPWVDDAFITAYYNNRRITMDKASELVVNPAIYQIEYVSTYNNDIASNVRSYINTTSVPKYRVQLGRYIDLVPIEIFDIFMKLGDVEQHIEPDGTFLYFTSSYPQVEQARKRLIEVLDLGIENAFITEEVNGESIPLSYARRGEVEKK